MRITLHLEDDEPVPCVCKVGPILRAFPGADLLVVPTVAGKVLREGLKRANIHVSDEGETHETSSVV